MLPAFSTFDRSSSYLATFFSLDNSTSLCARAVSFRFPSRCLSRRNAKWNARPINNANTTPWHQAALHPPKPNSLSGDLFRVYLNSIIHNAWAARGGGRRPRHFFFPPPGRSPELNSRVADLCRRCFFARGFLPPPFVTLASAMFPLPAQNGRHRRGVLPCEAPRDSPWKFSVFLPVTSTMQQICKRRTRAECASTKREIGKEIFVEETRNYERKAALLSERKK